MSREINIKDLFVATPLSSEDKDKYGFRFCLVKDKNVLVLSQGKVEKAMYMMEDMYGVPEYYTDNLYLQRFLDNKEYLFKNYKQLVNLNELCNTEENNSVELVKLLLTEKAVNGLYLEFLNEENEELSY